MNPLCPYIQQVEVNPYHIHNEYGVGLHDYLSPATTLDELNDQLFKVRSTCPGAESGCYTRFYVKFTWCRPSGEPMRFEMEMDFHKGNLCVFKALEETAEFYQRPDIDPRLYKLTNFFKTLKAAGYKLQFSPEVILQDELDTTILMLETSQCSYMNTEMTRLVSEEKANALSLVHNAKRSARYEQALAYEARARLLDEVTSYCWDSLNPEALKAEVSRVFASDLMRKQSEAVSNEDWLAALKAKAGLDCL